MRTICACLALSACAAQSGCATQAGLPSPEPVVDAYVAAIQSGDADALYALMTEESRQALSRDELQRVLSEQKDELAEHAASLAAEDRDVTAHAEVRFDDGEIISLDLDEGRFGVTAADALPAAARTPAQALGQLRRVLARRSYAGLLRVLSPTTRAAVERDLRSLVEGLDDPEALEVVRVGDSATGGVPGGHGVTLRHE